MEPEKPRTFNQFIALRIDSSDYESTVKEFWQEMLADEKKSVDKLFLYDVFPSRVDCDILIWAVKKVVSEDTVASTFNYLRSKLAKWKGQISPVFTFWGVTKPSIYAKGKSPQELDPFSDTRDTYLVVYPFVKTAEWYLLSTDTRKGMMNEHIRTGRQYPEIKQLLLYSFGVQDQEFVVVYEMQDILRFIDLVQDLRSTQVRLYTKRDTPVISATFRWAS